MVEIKENLQVELLPDGRSAILLKDYKVKNFKCGVSVIVPKDFKTDFASVPRIFWSLIPPFGKYSPAAVVHDYLYYQNVYSRKDSDLMFFEMMKILGVPIWKRVIMYVAVRLFGKRTH